MSVIQASSAGVKDMADGSLRITLEFEPRHAKEAYSLFGARGTACAVAALTQAATTQAAQVETVADTPKEKVGPLCIMACNFCKSPRFQKWLRVTNEASARQVILETCGINRRTELDSNKQAAAVFLTEIRAPYMEWSEPK